MRWTLALFLSLVPACRHAAPKGPPPDPSALLAQALAAHRLPRTLSAEAKAFVDAPENGGRYSLEFAVEKPDSLRLQALTPLGDPAAVLVAHRGQFSFFDVRNDVFYRGPASPENLSRLLPSPLRDEELVALLTGGIPELRGAGAVSTQREGDDVRLFLAAGAVVEEVLLGEDLRVKEVRRSLCAGKPQILWTVRLEDHDGRTGQQIPGLLHLSVPARRVEIDLSLRNVLAGKPPPRSAFALRPPPGVRIEDLP